MRCRQRHAISIKRNIPQEILVGHAAVLYSCSWNPSVWRAGCPFPFLARRTWSDSACRLPIPSALRGGSGECGSDLVVIVWIRVLTLLISRRTSSHLPFMLSASLRRCLQCRRRLVERQEEADLVVAVVRQRDRGALRAFFDDRVAQVFLGGDRNLEAEHVGGFLGRLVVADELEALALAVGVFDQQRAIGVAAVADVVDLLFADQRFGRDDALDRFDLGDARRVVAVLDAHFGAEVDGVADEPFFVRLQVEDARVAGVGRAFEHGDRALRQVHARRVLELQAEQRVLGLHARVVDAETRCASTSLLMIGSRADFCRPRLTG